MTPTPGNGDREPVDPAPDTGTGPARRVRLRAPDGPLRGRIEPARRRTEVDSRTWIARVMDRFGWRTYAIPVLAVASVLFVSNIAGGASGPKHSGGHHVAATSGVAGPQATAGSGGGSTGAPTHRPATHAAKPPHTSASPSPAQTPGADAPTVEPTAPSARDAAKLPAGKPYPMRGDGSFDVVPGSSPVAGTGPVRHYAVEVEGGMSGVDAQAFASAVVKTLSDARSWTRSGVALQRVDSGPIDFRVTLTSVMTERTECGYEIHVETSCYNGAQGRAFINVARWTRGAVAYGSDLAGYRDYVVNHEVGHALGHGHMKCPKAGALAPLMMEQTLGITTPGVGTCRPNPWPYRDGHYVTGPPTQGY